MLFSAVGCSEAPLTANEDEIILSVDLSGVSQDVFRVDMTYSLDGELIGGQACSHANGTVLDRPAVFWLDTACSPENSTLDNFSFYVALSGDDKGLTDMFSSAEIMNHSN